MASSSPVPGNGRQRVRRSGVQLNRCLCRVVISAPASSRPEFLRCLSRTADSTLSVNTWPRCDAGSPKDREIMVDDHGGSDRRAALRERAAGVLAEYHEIEASEAALLLYALAEHLSCSVDALAAEVVRGNCRPYGYRRTRLGHRFDLARSPGLVEEGLQRAVQAQDDEPALLRVGLDPVARGNAIWPGRREADDGAAVGLGLGGG